MDLFNKYQVLTLMLSTGKEVSFTGPAFLDPESYAVSVIGVSVTAPTELPPGCSFRAVPVECKSTVAPDLRSGNGKKQVPGGGRKRRR